MTTLYNSEVESLEECGRRIIGELWEAYRKEQRTVIDGEVDIKEFRWRSHLVHWEKYRRIDLDDTEGRFKHSEITRNREERVEPEMKPAPKKARQMLLAQYYHQMPASKAYKNKKDGLLANPKAFLNEACAGLYSGVNKTDEARWSELVRMYDEIMESTTDSRAGKENGSVREILTTVKDSWERPWGKNRQRT